MVKQDANDRYEPKGIVFKRDVDGEVVIVNATLHPQATRERFPYVAVFTLPYGPGNNGLPILSELSRLRKIQAQITDRMHPAILLGHAIGSNKLQIVFCGSTPQDTPVTIKTGLLSKETFKPEARHDPEWSVYAHLLEPTEVEAQFARNEQLLGFLEEQGDKAHIARSVDFTLLFPSEAERAAFLVETSAAGYAIADELMREDEGGFWCQVAKVTSLEPETIGTETAYFDRVASRHGGELDGWACNVTTE